MSEDIWAVATEETHRLEGKLATETEYVRGGKLTKTFMALGMTDKKFVDTLMVRVKNRVGTETDIVKHMETSNVDLFSSLRRLLPFSQN